MDAPAARPDPPTSPSPSSRPATPIPSSPADGPTSTADTRFPFPAPPALATATNVASSSAPASPPPHPKPWYTKVLDQTGIEIPKLWVSSPPPSPMPGPTMPAIAAGRPSCALVSTRQRSSILKEPSHPTILEEPLEAPLYPQRKNSIERRRSLRAAAAAAAARDRNRGPPQPNLHKLLSGRDLAVVAAEMDISPEALQEIAANKNPIIERWGPVLAKCTRTVKTGLLRLLNRDYSEENSTVGETIGHKLEKCGAKVLESARSALSTGWRGWKYTLDESEIALFLAGKCAEAEQAATLLLKLANATDRTNIYGIFV